MNGLSLSSKILSITETSSSIGMFVRDTGGCLLSKLATARSKEEAEEISFAELSESAIFYFSAPAMAKLTSNIFADKYNLRSKILSQPVNSIKNKPPNSLKNIKLAKFGQIASTFSIILPLVFGIAPLRNIITYSNSGKDEFVSVVGLKKEKSEKKEEEAKEQAQKLIKKLMITAMAGLAATFGILNAAENNKIYKKLEPIISKTVEKLEFSKTGDLKLVHYGTLIYPVSIASYFYASRDKYEKQENARRFSVTVPLLFFGEKLIEKPVYKGFDKLFNTKVFENGKIKSYEEIFKLPVDIQKQYLKSKNRAYGLTFLINTMAIAAGIGILNRIATKNKFKREEEQKNGIH